MTPTSVLDAWALVALLRDEASAGEVERAIEAGALASWINLGEVIYVEAPRVGLPAARTAVIRLSEILLPEEPDAELVQQAAAIKAGHPLSYADSFAVATAERHDLPLLTGDREILRLRRARLRIADLQR